MSSFLARHRSSVDDDVLASPEYCLNVFFVPVAANRERSADAVVRFIPPAEVTPEMKDQLSDIGVVEKRRIIPVASAGLVAAGRGREPRVRAAVVPLHDGHPHKMLEVLQGKAVF